MFIRRPLHYCRSVYSTPSLDPIRVLVVDHNRILRDGICVLIGMEPNIELVGAVATADSALMLFNRERPDLTLIDLDLQAGNGLEVIRRIRESDPAAWLIALATDEWDECSPRALAGGASCVIAKDLIGERLLPTIRSSWAKMAGKTFIAPKRALRKLAAR